MTKALNRILQQAVPEVSMRPPASAIQLIALTSHGDLRSAINSLQLLCSRELGHKGHKRKKKDEEGGVKKKGKGSRGGRGAKVDISDDLRAV
jgi:cell cycle checkpoint protein